MKKFAPIGAAAVLAVAAFAVGPASAHGNSTCSGLGGIAVHGQHIVGDYVTGLGGIGGGRVAAAPGAPKLQAQAGSGQVIGLSEAGKGRF